MAITKAQARQQHADRIAQTLDAQLVKVGERMQNAERTLSRARDEYAQLIQARTDLRELAQ